jgi:hypothetical protein
MVLPVPALTRKVRATLIKVADVNQELAMLRVISHKPVLKALFIDKFFAGLPSCRERLGLAVRQPKA